jgi:hypothetical protein
MRDPDDAEWVDDRDWSRDLDAKRGGRERRRAKFLEKALRTPRTARRWFRIDDIEPDAHVRSNLIDQWRASIWHRDLLLAGKSQVLCLSVSPLAENRFDPDMARGEQFNAAIGDLWMSAPRWLAWFRQDEANRKAPAWLEDIMQSRANYTEEFWQIPDKEPRQKALAIAWRGLRKAFPGGRIPKHLNNSAEKLARTASKASGEIVTRESISRVLGRKR